MKIRHAQLEKLAALDHGVRQFGPGSVEVDSLGHGLVSASFARGIRVERTGMTVDSKIVAIIGADGAVVQETGDPRTSPSKRLREALNEA